MEHLRDAYLDLAERFGNVCAQLDDLQRRCGASSDPDGYNDADAERTLRELAEATISHLRANIVELNNANDALQLELKNCGGPVFKGPRVETTVAELHALLQRALNTQDPQKAPQWAMQLSDKLFSQTEPIDILFTLKV